VSFLSVIHYVLEVNYCTVQKGFDVEGTLHGRQISNEYSNLVIVLRFPDMSVSRYDKIIMLQ